LVVTYKRHQRSDILAAAVEAVLDEGLTKLTFGRLATRLEIADRTIVYYFPTKEDLLTGVLDALSLELFGVLEAAFGNSPLPADDLLRRAWPALTTARSDRVFRFYLEFLGLAAAKHDPYVHLAPPMFDAFVKWLKPKIAPPATKAKSTTKSFDANSAALVLLTTLDGLLLLRHVHGPRSATKAAKAMGVIG
jgi:AcrR family transcriptional regulator